MGGKWFDHSYRRNLVDMHINDADPVYLSQYDPVKYVDNLVAARVDTAILYAGNCLGICFWPTSAGHIHQSLNGRDILKEVIAECRKRGLHVVVYYNIWSRWAYDHFPEWRYRDANGRGMYVESEGKRYGMCCSNSGYADYVYRQVDDLAGNYDMDGLWVDMIGWFGGVCFCDSCKRLYAQESGRPFPERIDWRDEHWRDFQQHREAWHAEFARKIREKVLARKPGISVAFQSASWSLGWGIGLSTELYRQSDYLAGDFYGDPVEQSFVCKYLESLSPNRPVEFMVSRCPTLEEHTITRPKELLEAQVYSAIAANASFVFIDAIDPLGTMNPEVYRLMGEIFGSTMAYEPYLGPQLKRRAEVGIYVDIHSLASMKDNGKPIAEVPVSNLTRNLLQTAATLIRHKIPYDVVTRPQLGRLSDFQVLILPDAFMLDRDEAEAIRRFVSQGGSLYASKNTAWIHGHGDSLLSDVFGVSRQGETAENETYLSPVPGFDGLNPFTQNFPLEIRDTQALVSPLPGAEVLATLTLPFTPPNDPYEFSSAISNPPGRFTAHPSLVRNHFGKGICIYSAGAIEAMPHDAQGGIFAGLVRSLLTRPACFETDAPRPVEITLYEDPAQKRWLVCVLNFQKELPNLPVFDIKIKVNLPGNDFAEVLSLPGSTPIPCDLSKGSVSFTVDRLDTFRMFAINLR